MVTRREDFGVDKQSTSVKGFLVRRGPFADPATARIRRH
jgi:myo-inositol catabolism protein IolC